MHPVTRLHNSFHAEHYNIAFHLEKVDQKIVTGSVTIRGEQVGHALKLHAKDLSISAIKVNDAAVPFHTEGDELVIDSPELGKKYISIDYSLKLTDAMHGIYPCYYEVNGQKQQLIATQFESHHAREAFPCIDEPEAKAVFDVTITCQPSDTALSNMPVMSRETRDSLAHTTFDSTPRMSPYLLAFVVGDLRQRSATTKDGVEVNIWATKVHDATSLDFALDVSVRTIEFFNEYFDTPYPLPKCDHVALPDFSSGAMENWGLITYREICLLVDEATAVSTKQFVATVIAHEVSHQWFGNLVTMKWWDDLWLNESFATLMEYVAVDALFPQWDIWMTFATNETLSALRRDYLPGIQAVKTDVSHPDEISTLFDPSIVYAKGARLLAMLREYIGDRAFQTGLTAYFKEHAYGNTIGADLWQSLSEASGKDVANFMTPWLEQSGMPVVQVTLQGDKSQLIQRRFLIPDDVSLQGGLWPIPIRSGKHFELFDTPMRTVATALPINSGSTVHAVYAYDPASLAIIKDRFMDGGLEKIDRLSLLHELSLVTKAGLQPTTDLLDLLELYDNEMEEPVWDIIALVYADLKRFVDTDKSAEDALKARVVRHASPLYETLGWTPHTNENESTTKLRSIILGLLSYADYKPLIDDGLALYRSTPKLEALDGELRPLLATLAVKHGTDQEIEHIITLHNSSQNAEVKQDMSLALTATRDAQLAQRLLMMMTDETSVRPQDIDKWFVYLMRNRYTRELTWQWLTEKWTWIATTFKGDKSYDSFPRYAASSLSTYEWLNRFKEFFTPLLHDAALTRAITLGEKDIESRAEWIQRDSLKVTSRLTQELQ